MGLSAIVDPPSTMEKHVFARESRNESGLGQQRFLITPHVIPFSSSDTV
ncbi:hypothetical protein [Sphingomonas morindae]|uniref:Uncharacterized protein n=1 Tax=Sphingomonas morindae TaxID=1541170 RepID=A0ABY4XAR6_9SPHN|nr:hypothetical protein [Sphingomonas morindae]USI74050.1 hypothetical protein LHA26_06200 [Sphingomonas morindae]